jgi:MraZ protein
MDTPPPSSRAFYAGEFRHAVDDKNRITIPARWRGDAAEEFILLPQADHQFLLVMSPEEFSRVSAEAESNPNVSPRDRRIFLRHLHSRAEHAASDRQGRLVLPENPQPERRGCAGGRAWPLRDLEFGALEEGA